jgi:hypothetical protein|tara:strand:+ start:336 stop:458 length:123 start_codon:yes stop_codon:yes gene_type:complete
MSYITNEEYLQNRYEEGINKGMTDEQAQEYACKCLENDVR